MTRTQFPHPIPDPQHPSGQTTALDRLIARVMPQSNGCWRWAGEVDRNGYGHIGRAWAHRAVYEALVGPIAEGLHLDHLCRVPLCVNPLHLEPVTPRENFLRSDHPQAIAHRTDTCKRGHSLLDAHRLPNGSRRCRPCDAHRANGRYIRVPEAGRLPHRGRSTATHCPEGHAWTEENTYQSGKARYCRACHRTSAARGRAVQAALREARV